MIYIICGLPGTGKTSLCRILAEKLNCAKLSDWEIFKRHGIKIADNTPKSEVCKQYRELLINNIMKCKSKDLVVDLEYSILPNDYKNSALHDKSKIVYLGFTSTPLSILFKLFRQSDANNKYSDSTLMQNISFYKKQSQACFLECKKENLDFFDINTDRKIIFESIIELFGISH